MNDLQTSLCVNTTCFSQTGEKEEGKYVWWPVDSSNCLWSFSEDDGKLENINF